LPETTVVSGLVTVVHVPENAPQLWAESVADSRWITPEPGLTPEPESLPFEVVTVIEPAEPAVVG
jgi:hypothetical protein